MKYCDGLNHESRQDPGPTVDVKDGTYINGYSRNEGQKTRAERHIGGLDHHHKTASK